MKDMIEVQPTPEQRRAFATWAVRQKPKWRTVSPTSFAVPEDRFIDLPEELLIGSLVDGHRYVSPDEDAQEGRAAPGELLGVATAAGFSEERTAFPGEPLPEAPLEAYGPDSVPLPAPDPADEHGETPEGVYLCLGCDREFTTARGRDTHQRQKHPEA